LAHNSALLEVSCFSGEPFLVYRLINISIYTYILALTMLLCCTAVGPGWFCRGGGEKIFPVIEASAVSYARKCAPLYFYESTRATGAVEISAGM
jgi:hypothetical protein